MLWWTHFVCFWFVALFFEVLDQTWIDRTYYKHDYQGSGIWRFPDELTFVEQAPTCFKNQMILWFYLTYLHPIPMQVTEVTWLEAFCDTLGVLVTYDVIFLLGHALLHTSWFYPLHKQHHQTHATKALSSNYMGSIDYMIESIIPFALYPLLKWYLLGLDTSESVLTYIVCIGATLSQYEHSGYHFVSHWLATQHHVHHLPGYGSYNLGRLATYVPLGKFFP